MIDVNYYVKLALKLVPKGHDRGREDLRRDISATLAAEVEKALARQRAENFPELASLEAACKKQLADTQRDRATLIASQESTGAAFKRRETALAADEKRLKAVFAAVEAYDKWCQLEGPTDEAMKRIDDLRSACAAFREKK